MAFIPKTWVDDQIVYAEDMNRIEQGIANAVSVTPQTLTDAQKTQARANIAAAPDGFGLGNGSVTLTSSDNLDNVTGNGWYYWGSSVPANAPTLIHAYSSPGYCGMFMIGSSQIVVSFNARNNMAMRSENNEGWTPWEYINPTLKIGVEYRTTERYQEKPVYTRLVDFGSFPNSTQKDVQIPEEGFYAQNVCIDFTKSVVTYPNDTRTSILPFKNGITEISVNNACVRVTTSSDLSRASGYICVKYTKSTD